jgi:large subunit ribosomal protein L16
MLQPKKTKFRKAFKGRISGTGKGKGAPEFWAARVKPGRIMFEIDGVPEDIAREALRLGAAKLPIRTRFIQRIAE